MALVSGARIVVDATLILLRAAPPQGLSHASASLQITGVSDTHGVAHAIGVLITTAGNGEYTARTGPRIAISLGARSVRLAIVVCCATIRLFEDGTLAVHADAGGAHILLRTMGVVETAPLGPLR